MRHHHLAVPYQPADFVVLPPLSNLQRSFPGLPQRREIQTERGEGEGKTRKRGKPYALENKRARQAIHREANHMHAVKMQPISDTYEMKARIKMVNVYTFA